MTLPPRDQLVPSSLFCFFPLRKNRVSHCFSLYGDERDVQCPVPLIGIASPEFTNIVSSKFMF
jgi:hypothetical protein